MVSGCEFLQLVEAAHIDPYRGTANNHLENGILLRTDLHTLFDLGLFAIDPKNLTVHFHRDALSIADYGSLATGRLLIDAHYPLLPMLSRDGGRPSAQRILELLRHRIATRMYKYLLDLQ